MTLRGRTNSLFVSSSATEALFRQPVPPELDPAQLLDAVYLRLDVIEPRHDRVVLGDR